MLINIDPVHIPERSTLADLYIHHFDQTSHLYTYAPYRQSSYDKRLAELQNADGRLNRSSLTAALRSYNERVNPHRAVRANIDLLERADSAVVIGGQQAGVMTGPLYTIYKAITIIQLARQQSEKLQVPVVPVFWIAGEDHDLAEVNHIWIRSQANRPHKLRFGKDDGRYQSIGKRRLTMSDVDEFLKQVADCHPDTPYKNLWVNELYQLADDSHTLSDWFARIFHHLFGDAGLVLYDSSAEEFSHIVAPFYERLLERSGELREAVYAATKQVEQMGFQPQVEQQPGQANMFIEESGERELLFEQGKALVTNRTGTTYSRQTISEIVKTDPDRLSTNVVSRPLLQEYLFPTLAAVLGPGEIAYWGLYGKAFSLFGWHMPILFPRLQFTLVERDCRETMENFNLSPVNAMFHLQSFREQWLRDQDHIGISALFSELKNDIATLHETKTRPLSALNRGIEVLAQKNRIRILHELRYLENQAQRTIRQKNKSVLDQLDRLQHALTPNGKPQERVYNVFSYVNEYGWDWFNNLVRKRLDLAQLHYMVYL